MRAPFNNAAFLQNQDQVGVTHGGESVRDDKGGASAEQAMQGPLDELFRGRVDAGGRFIEHQHRRIFQERPRDGDALLLAHGKLHAALADMRVVAFRQTRRRTRARRPRAPSPRFPRRVASGRPKRRLSRIVPLKRNVSCETTPICSRKFAERNAGHVAAIEQDFAIRRLVKTAEQRNESRFPRAGRTDQGDALARLYRKIDFMQGRNVGTIGKGDVAILDLAPRARRVAVARRATVWRRACTSYYRRNSRWPHRGFRPRVRWRRGPPGRAG